FAIAEIVINDTGLPISTSCSLLQGVHQHCHPAAADQAVVPPVVVVEAKGQYLGPSARSQNTEGALLNFGLDAASAQRPALPAVGEDEHGCPGLLRRRAARLDHRTINTVTALVQDRRKVRK